MPSAHTHLEIEANLIYQGAVSYLFGGERVEVCAGEWAIFWGSIPHQLIVFQENIEMSWFTLPLSRFLGWNLPTTLTNCLLHGQIIKENADMARDTLNFASWERDLGSGEVARIHIVELEMQARLRRLAIGLEARESPIRHTTRGEIGHVEKMAAFMTQNYADAIQIEDVAKAAEIHPNYAMNLFKRGFGLSIREFLTRIRLSQVQRLLVTTNSNILDIAFSCGFGSASRFHAVFKEQCGQSPADYRKTVQS